ncbi:hypothetical protein [Moraxella boevrei]|uniref:hypothetical protein n=1 Tax=Faucicola boevrei TaxID=346665 RepID=UPI00373698C1
MPNMPSLLLIGFTETNANVIQIFLEMTFKNVQVSQIVRNLGQSVLELPVLNDEEKRSDIFIIDFEGVGLDLAYSKQSKNLETYTNGKPILFVARQNETIPITFAKYEFLTMPYTRQQMTDRIKAMLESLPDRPVVENVDTTNKASLLNSLPKNPSKAVQDLINESFAGTKTANAFKTDTPKSTAQPVTTLNNQNTINKEPVSVDDVQKVFALLGTIFPDIVDRPLFTFAKKLQSLKDFAMVNINGYLMYVNPIDKSIITDNLERIGDSFLVGAGLKEESLTFQSLDANSFRQKTTNYLASGAKQYNLAQVIWLIGLELMQIRRNSYVESHEMQIQATFMPNFSGVKFVPSYVVPLIASCLGRPRTLLDFNKLFPQLTNAQVNQVLLLLIMSRAVNYEILLNSSNNSSVMAKPIIQNPKSDDNSMNIGVQKANKTGFLSRLLNRLGVA